MNVLFVLEIDWLKKVVFELQSLAELLSLRGHRVYAIDYENSWGSNSHFSPGSLKTREYQDVSRAFAGSSVTLRRPGFIKVPGLSRLSAAFTHYVEIDKTIKEKDIDVIVLYGIPTNGLQTVYLAKKYNIPVVFRSIDILRQLTPYAMLRPATRFFEKRVYPRVDMILALTPELSRYVVRLGAREAKVRILPMLVDTDLFHPLIGSGELRSKLGFAESDPIIVFIGTLFDFSGLDILIHHFPEILERIPAAKLLIVGDGPQRPALDNIIDRLGLQKKVIITGFQPYPTMPQYINLAAVCINPFLVTDATREIFPSKIVQYLACARPVIATPLPGMLAVTSGEEQGILYAENTDDMSNKIISLLQSGEHMRRLGQAGLEYVRRVHSHEKVAEQLEKSLEEAIREKRNPGRIRRSAIESET
jgi:glycosyltransferase involved in cell wall biosynthesis